MSTPSGAALSVISEHVDRYRHEIADMVANYRDGDHDDVIAALYEAERLLRSAARAVRTASVKAG